MRNALVTMNINCRAWRALAGCVVLAGAVFLSACGPVRVLTAANVPPPLLVKMPVAVALFMPQEFSSYVHKEERGTSDWEIDIGKAQTDTLLQLMNAMFERVIPVESVNAGAQLGSQIQAILEPSIEEYAFVTPRDAGSEFFAVSIKYRVNVYSTDGKLADSWGFTGYGTASAGGLSHTEPLAQATALAMRDAGAKLAVEFREQAVIRELLPHEPTPDEAQPSATPAAGSASVPAITEAQKLIEGSQTAEPTSPTVPPAEAPAAPPEQPPEATPTRPAVPAEEKEETLPEVEAFARDSPMRRAQAQPLVSSSSRELLRVLNT